MTRQEFDALMLSIKTWEVNCNDLGIHEDDMDVLLDNGLHLCILYDASCPGLLYAIVHETDGDYLAGTQLDTTFPHDIETLYANILDATQFYDTSSDPDIDPGDDPDFVVQQR